MKKQMNYAHLRADIAAFAALKTFLDYNPANADYALVKVQTVADDMFAAQDRRSQLRGEQRAAHDTAIAAEWAFHDFMLGVKEQVRAQYGSDSDQVQSVGLKKKSNRARRSKSNAAPAAANQRPQV